VKYAMIDQLRNQHPISRLCLLLGVAKSGYQAWRSGKVIPLRKLQDVRLLVAIKAAHQRGRGIYGPKKIRDELAGQGIVAGLNRIKRLRKLHGIRCTHKKKFRVTTDSKHNLPVVENLLNRQFVPVAPNRVWVADITYIPTDEGWLFLAAIKDLHTCEIVGWAMDSRMTQTLVADALRAAYWRKKPKPGLMHHSDRGSQYCSAAYRALQASYGMKTSMSRKGNCWDNAPMESFFGTLKTESLHHYRFATREQARRVVFEYIEVFYNRIRRHAKIGNQVPADFANQHYACRQQSAA
jgi:putative transposase